MSLNRDLSADKIALFVSIMLVIGLGIASRVFQTGSILIDKYLGDAFYAILFYLLLSWGWPLGTPMKKAILTTLAMIIIELFQLTGLAGQLRRSDTILLKGISIVLGTHFAWFDLLAYLIGIVIIWVVDLYGFRRAGQQKNLIHYRLSPKLGV